MLIANKSNNKNESCLICWELNGEIKLCKNCLYKYCLICAQKINFNCSICKKNNNLNDEYDFRNLNLNLERLSYSRIFKEFLVKIISLILSISIIFFIFLLSYFLKLFQFLYL